MEKEMISESIMPWRETPEEIRQQQRFDLVKTIIGAWAMDFESNNTIQNSAKYAVAFADTILAEMERTK